MTKLNHYFWNSTDVQTSILQTHDFFRSLESHYHLSLITVCGEGRQPTKKVVSDSPGLVDFSIGLVNSVFNLPNGQVIFFEEFK